MVFCLQLDRPGLLLHCHRLFRDAVQLQARVRLLAPQVALSVVDNLLVLHYPALHCLSLLDPLAPSWEPLLPPLPLGRQGALSPAPAPAMARGLAPAASPDDAPAVEGARGTHHGTGSVDPTEYSRQWVFLSPCLVLDKAHGRLQRLALDLSVSGRCQGTACTPDMSLSASCQAFGAEFTVHTVADPRCGTEIYLLL